MNPISGFHGSLCVFFVSLSSCLLFLLTCRLTGTFIKKPSLVVTQNKNPERLMCLRERKSSVCMCAHFVFVCLNHLNIFLCLWACDTCSPAKLYINSRLNYKWIVFVGWHVSTKVCDQICLRWCVWFSNPQQQLNNIFTLSHVLFTTVKWINALINLSIHVQLEGSPRTPCACATLSFILYLILIINYVDGLCSNTQQELPVYRRLFVLLCCFGVS